MVDLKGILRAQGKAIPAHPALQSGEPITTYIQGANQGRDREPKIAQREAPRHLQAYGGQQDAIDWVMDCVRLYADTASGADWYFERAGKRLFLERTDETPDDAELVPDSLKLLFEEPNPYMPFSELVELLITDLLLIGNGYWLKWRSNEEGRPLAVYRLAPAYVKAVPSAFGIKRYEYQPPGAKEPLRIEPEEIIHFKLPNPHSYHYGIGLIQGGARALDLELALTDAQANYYENKADPSMIVQSERRVPRDVFNKLRAQLRARAQGTNRAGDLLVLEAGLTAKTLSPSARDALYAEITKLSRDRIFTMFRTSPMLFGLTDEAAGGNKITDARREFDNYVMRPFLKKLAERITLGLARAWGVNFVYDHRYVMPPEDLVKLASDFAALPGIKPKEVRQFLRSLGIEETTGDTEVDEMILNLPGEELDEDGQGGFPDRSLAGEPGRPPKGSNTRAFPKGGGALPVGSAARRGKKAMSVDDAIERVRELESKAVVQFEEPERTSVGRLSAEQAPSDPSASSRTASINAAQSFIELGLGDAARDLERDLISELDQKALKTSDLVSRVRRSRAWARFQARVEEVLAEGARRAANAGVINAGVRPDDDLDYDAIVKTVIHRPDGIRGIVRTLKDRVARRVRDARAADGERPDFNAAISDTVREWMGGSLTTVADTEATHAYNEATLTAAEAAGVTEVYVTDGEDHDEPCKEAHGSVWDIETARENRLEHPRCRRAFLPLPATA